jgi:NDP-sugar pyrophosphorylase family protein
LVHPRSIENLALDPYSRVSLEDEIVPFCCELGHKLRGVVCSDTFIDIGTPSDYMRAQSMPCFDSRQ